MAQTFFFYDLETSGLSARDDRIMQFAGQRTTLDLEPVGEPLNVLVRLNDDTLPSPEAVMVTGITPQSTQADGMSEAEFARLLQQEVFTDDTITVGFNSVRFDDEFIRHLFWRTFHDPYEWSWSQGRSRWDMLDVVRMTRALRPAGIEWPVDKEGNPTNRLELLTTLNGIGHTKAHDALSDVEALIDVARLIQSKQPELFRYLLNMREKKAVKGLVSLDDRRPFVYTSGRYDATWAKTTVAFPLTSAPNANVLVYDLRHDPKQFFDLSETELASRAFAPWDERRQEGFVPLPVKVLQYNRCPAVAPLGVLQKEGWQAIGLELGTVETHRKLLLEHPDFAERLRTVYEQRPEFPRSSDAEARLYDGFISGPDSIRIESVRNADERQLADFHPEFSDERLSDLLLRYKARNASRSLQEDEMSQWEQWRAARLTRQLPGYMASLQRLSQTATDEQRFLLEELQLWAEAIMPAPDEH